MIKDKIFCVPYNHMDSLVREIEKYKNCIYELYGADNNFLSCMRTDYVPLPEQFENHVKKIKSYGIQFNYVLNLPDMSYYFSKKHKIVKKLKYLADLGVDSITCSSPLLCEEISKHKFKIVASVVQNIDSESKIRHLEKYGYSRIIISEHINKQIQKMKYLLSITDCEFEVLVNNICMKDCLFMTDHYRYIRENEMGIRNAILNQCRNIRKDPINFFKSSFVRPEDVKRYRQIGVKYIKIGGRNDTAKHIIHMLKSFRNEKYNGEIDDFCNGGWKFISNEYNIKSCDLEEFSKWFFEDKIGCNGECSNCKHCEIYMEKLRYK